MKPLSCFQGEAVAATIRVSLFVNRPIGAEEKPASKTKRAWMLEEAQAELRFYPRDPYLQNVVLQLARRENKQETGAGRRQNAYARPGAHTRREPAPTAGWAAPDACREKPCDGNFIPGINEPIAVRIMKSSDVWVSGACQNRLPW